MHGITSLDGHSKSSGDMNKAMERMSIVFKGRLSPEQLGAIKQDIQSTVMGGMLAGAGEGGEIAESVAISAPVSSNEKTSRSSAMYAGLCAAVTADIFCWISCRATGSAKQCERAALSGRPTTSRRSRDRSVM